MMNDRAIRRLLKAGSGKGEDVSLSPYFFQRLQHRIRSEVAAQPSYSIGFAAIKMLPSLLLIVILICGWAGYENVRTARVREAALSRIVSSPGGLGDAVLAFVLEGGAQSNGEPQ